MTARALTAEARQDIADVLVRYAAGIDQRDWALFRTCFTDDVDADYGDTGHFHGVDDITQWMDRTHADFGYTLHRISNPHITVTAGGATTRCYVDAVIMAPDGKSGVNAIGFYDDEFVETADGWRIVRRRFTNVRITALT